MIYIMLSILALIVGSFLNVLIYRLPKMLEYRAHQECAILMNLPLPQGQPLNLALPRSHCPHCQTTIPWYRNIPLLSFCLQKGRCAHCHKAIPRRYLWVELTTLSATLLAIACFGIQLKLYAVLIFMWLMIPLIWIDMQHMLLPNELTYTLLWSGLIINCTELFCPLQSAVIGAACAYLILWTVTSLYHVFTGKVGMGQGDLKLFAALGAWLGWFSLPQILLLSSFSGAIIGMIYLKKTHQKKSTPFPFGPFLGLSGIYVMLMQAHTWL